MGKGTSRHAMVGRVKRTIISASCFAQLAKVHGSHKWRALLHPPQNEPDAAGDNRRDEDQVIDPRAGQPDQLA